MHHKEYLGARKFTAAPPPNPPLQLEINSWKQELARLHTHKSKLVRLPDRTEYKHDQGTHALSAGYVRLRNSNMNENES